MAWDSWDGPWRSKEEEEIGTDFDNETDPITFNREED